jgi:mono/diheme cytochrome c family protein
LAAGVTGVLALVSAIGSTADLEAQAKAAAPRNKAAASATAMGAGQAAGSAQAGAGSVAPAGMVARGKYLVTTGACEDCHTPWTPSPKGPPAPDPTRMLSGHPASVRLTPPPRLPEGWGMVASATNTAFAGPWGVSYAANLTPDKETGLGNWTEEMFISALRKGRHAGVERQILPPMPWPAYAQMSDQDLKAIFAYLRSVKPIKNAVPSPAPPMPAL